MKLINFKFSKINAEKISQKIEGLKIGTSIDINSIEEIESKLIKSKDVILNVKFNYTINYNNNIAKIELSGNIMFSLEEKIGKKVLEDWKKKKLNDEIRLNLFNLILKKSNIKAIQIEEDLNLPIHFNLPSLKIEDKK